MRKNDLNEYFFLDRNPDQLFGANKKVESGEHGISMDKDGQHYATSFHIYKDDNENRVLARPQLREFLTKKYSGRNDLTNAYRLENPIKIEVKYVGQNFVIKKVCLEWIVDMYERENKSVSTSNEQNDLTDVIDSLKQISQIKHLQSPSHSHRKLFDEIIYLIENNHDKLELLSLTFMPVFFEKLCYVLSEESEQFKQELDEYRNAIKNTNEIKKTSEGFKFSSFHYLCSIKYQSIKDIGGGYKINSSKSIKNFRFDQDKSLSKMYEDIFYFFDKRNDLIHAQFVSEDMSEWVNSSKKLIRLMLVLKRQYLEE